MAYTAHCYLLEHLDLLVAERTGRCHYDALAGMNAERVDVLHARYGEAMVVGIAYYLKLYLLPALEALLDEHLGCKGKCALGYLAEGLLIGTHTAAESAQCVGRTYHDGIAYAASRSDGIVYILTRLRDGDLEVNLVELLDKEIAVFGIHDGLYACAQDLDAVLLERAVEVKFCAAVEGCLASERQKYAVGAFFLDYLRHEVCVDGLEVYLVGNTLARLDSGNVGVYQHRLDPLLAKCLEGLRTTVVKLSGLSDLQST